MENVQYYCVGFTWKGSEPESQLERFTKNGIWENGFEDRYIDRVNSVQVGARLAAKTSFTRKENNETISVLKVYRTGTVTQNPQNGKTLKVKWDKNIKTFSLDDKGSYRSTIARIHDLETIKEIFKNDDIPFENNQTIFYRSDLIDREYFIYPCFVLTRDRWDDFSYKTQYYIQYYQSEKNPIEIGHAKFWNKVDKTGELPESFTELGDEICSLGQSNDYYLDLRERFDKSLSDYYLNAVNDLPTNRGIRSEFEHEEVVKVSLLRSSEAQKAFREGQRIYNGIDVDKNFVFTFSAQIGNALEEHSIKFDFSDIDDLPFRIKVIIGKNGAGKTQYISRLASSLSGHQKLGNFSTRYLPPFSRVIAISYSLFDSFPRPKDTKTYSYYYCGFQGAKGFLSPNQINSRLGKAFRLVEKSDRIRLFGLYISEILSEEIALELLDEDFSEITVQDFALYDKKGHSKYSSGQIIMILIVAELLAYITSESLIIVDEPETHLHPNSMSLFISVINKILNKFDSYCITTTHSPQVVQEVPSKDVIVLEKFENMPIVRKLDIESFGENLNTITERIFQTASHDEFYRKFLSNLAKEKSYDTIIRLFENSSRPLSLSAKIFLQSLYQ